MPSARAPTPIFRNSKVVVPRPCPPSSWVCAAARPWRARSAMRTRPAQRSLEIITHTQSEIPRLVPHRRIADDLRVAVLLHLGHLGVAPLPLAVLVPLAGGRIDEL